jgi:hypothetical protein
MEHSNGFLEKLDNHLSNLSALNKDVYVFLDANIDLLKLNTLNLCNDYMDVNLSNGFIQLICRATRIQGIHYSLIDHILTNTNQPNYSVGTIVSDISDHFINFIKLSIDNPPPKHKVEVKRKFTGENIARFKNALSNFTWDDVCAENDIDKAFDIFWTKFNDLYNLNFPTTRTKFNRNLHKINNYMTAGLMISRATKLELCKKATRDRNNIATENYRRYRNIYNSLLRTSKKMYFDKNFDLFKKNPKKTWDLLKEATNLNKSNNQIEKLMINNEISMDKKQIANAFNDFFVKVGVNISESIIPTNAKAEDFMPINDDIEQIDLGTTNATHFCDIVKALQPKCSLDADGLSTKLLKGVALEISRPLSYIFNLSLVNGIFPKKLKKSRTVPIFKAGDPTSCDNYRPIALLSSLSKILEKMVSVKLVNHLDFNKLLYKHQYGFQKNKSTEHNLVQALNYIGQAFNDNK